MGAVGTKAAIDQLNDIGHQVIELERYCAGNKIWAAKIKVMFLEKMVAVATTELDWKHMPPY